MTPAPMAPPPDPFWAAAALQKNPPGDCAAYVMAILKCMFGRDVFLPRRPGSLRGKDRVAGTAIAASLAVSLDEGTSPSEGDGVLMRAAGRKVCIGHHIGLWTRSGGQPYVLHRLEDQRPRLDPLAGLEHRGLALTGLYRWT